MIARILQVPCCSLLLLLALAPLVSGLIKTLKARLQIRRGPGILQPYRDLHKLFRKGMVIPDTASWIFAATPYVVFVATAAGGPHDSHDCRRGAARACSAACWRWSTCSAWAASSWRWADSIPAVPSAAWAAAGK